MRTLLEPARTGHIAPRRIVMLPAAYTQPEDFLSAGFVRALRERALNVDLVFAAPELEHVTDRSVLDKIASELIAPARAQGCIVWLGGISLGGFIALCCAARAPHSVSGLCLLAPYLGSHIITEEIRLTGGISAWEPGPPQPQDDEERRVWRFLKRRSAAELPIHLGLGRDDRFGGRHRLLAAALTEQEVDTVAGGHDWPTWYRLWENFLDARFASPV